MKLRDAGAEGLILCEFGVGVATFAKALNTIGWHPPFTSSWSNIYTALSMSSPPTLMDGAIPQSVCDRENPRVKKVLADYAKFTGKEGDFDDPIMMGYSCVMMFAHAAREAKTADDPTAIRDALYKVKFKDLPLGRKDSILYFTPERNWLVPNEDHVFMEVKGGKLVPFK
jgi:ABC-type branched-subunit amino acid transport system substrate-binding protein